MTKRESISHLLKRFGLGASEPEVAFYSQLGVEGSIDRLVDFEKVLDTFRVNLSEFYFLKDSTDVALGPDRVALWWLLQMIQTQRPLEEKLTLFWHNHLAVSGSKADFGPMMEGYLTILRRGVYAPFPELLKQVSFSPAMIRWLDIEDSKIDHPNENFAREVMELFTLGIGNYSEADIQSAARCFCGIGLRFPYYEYQMKNEHEKLTHFYQKGIPLIAHTITPEMLDSGERIIVGKRAKFGPHDVLNHLSDLDTTRSYIMTKLWAFFVGTEPSSKVINHLVQVFKKAHDSLKPVMREIAHMSEFWEPAAVGTMIKSPIDFTIGAYRQMQCADHLLAFRSSSATPFTPIDQRVVNELWGVQYLVREQGMAPLFPPDVSGWKFGADWVTSATMGFRAKVPDFLFNVYSEQGAVATFFIDSMVRDFQKSTTKEFVDRICRAYGVSFTNEQLSGLIKIVEQKGGPQYMKDRRTAADMIHSLSKVIFWSPEYQLC